MRYESQKSTSLFTNFLILILEHINFIFFNFIIIILISLLFSHGVLLLKDLHTNNVEAEEYTYGVLFSV